MLTEIIEPVTSPTVEILDAEDFAERHLLERKADFGFLGSISESCLNIIYKPIWLWLAIACHRLVAGDREGGKLDECEVVTLYETP